MRMRNILLLPLLCAGLAACQTRSVDLPNPGLVTGPVIGPISTITDPAAALPAPSVQPSPTPATQVVVPEKAGSQTIQKVVNATRAVCRFAPTVATVARLFSRSAEKGTVATVADYANEICAAVYPVAINGQRSLEVSWADLKSNKRKKERRPKKHGEVDGVPIEGKKL